MKELTTAIHIAEDEEDCTAGGRPLLGTPVSPVVGPGSRLLDVSCDEDEDPESIESTTVTSSPEPSLRSSGSLDKGRPNRGLWCLLGFGLVSFGIGALSAIFPPFELLMNERLRMIKGLPAFEWWKEPPDEVLMRLYIFNITNKEAFLAGREKLHMQEIGPWIFRERLRHTDVHFNGNGTMTYTAHRSAEFLPELSGGLDMDTPLVVANLGVLVDSQSVWSTLIKDESFMLQGMASYLWDSSFLTKLGLNMLLMQYDSQPISEMRAGDYMWNNSDPLFEMAGRIMPSLVPTTNLGIMNIMYEHFSDDVTVYMGLENSHRFFLIDQFKGSPRLNYWQDERCDLAVGASEGVAYPQFLTRNDSILYLRKTICRATPLYYARDDVKYGMLGLRFELPNNTFASGDEKPENACFRRRDDNSPNLPSGATDVSPCYYNFPIASSFPHFMHGSPALTAKLDGMTPDPDKHGSYVLVEPTTGVPMESKARSQSNLAVRPLYGLSPRVLPFSNMTVPMFWAEYNQVGLPWYISWLMYLVVEIIRPSQQSATFVMLSAGSSMLLAALLGLACSFYHHIPPSSSTLSSPANSTPTSRSYSSINLIAAASSSSRKSIIR